MEKLTLYSGFKYMMRCFIASCGLMLIIVFFYNGKEEITKELIQSGVSILFICLAFITMFYQVFKAILGYKETQGNIIFGEYYKAEKMDIEPNNENEKLMMEIIRIHEAGHAIMAYVLGVVIEQCIATKTIGQTQTKTLKCLMDACEYEKLILITYGGAVAEKIIYQKIRAGSVGDEHSDFRKAEELIKNMLLLDDEIEGYATGGEQFSTLVREKSTQLFNKAVSILSENKDMILRLSEELKNRPKITGEELKILLEKNQENSMTKRN